MPDLASELRRFVDTTPPVRLAEVARPRAWRAPVIAASVAAALLIAVVGGAVLLSRDDDSQQRVSTGSRDGSQVTCSPHPGCSLSPADAAKRVGFEIRVPTGIPGGWVLAGEYLAEYPVGYVEAPGIEPLTEAVSVYRQVWTPPGVSLTDECPPHVVVRQRLPRAGETGADRVGARGLGGTTDLGGGVIASGEVFVGATCGSLTVTSAMLSWVDHGIYFNLNSVGLTEEQVRAIGHSLND